MDGAQCRRRVRGADRGIRVASRRRRPLGDRDLGLAWRVLGERRRARFEEKNARLIVLTTESDTTADWMYAGQGLQKLLLTATHFGVQASFMTQPFEDLDRQPRKRPDTLWPWPRPWHIVIRLGSTPERDYTPHVNVKF